MKDLPIREGVIAWKPAPGSNDSVYPREAFIFLYAGKLEAKKGVDVLLQAFSMMNEVHAHLLIVGNGPQEAMLKKRYAHPRVHFIDFQNQAIMPVVYQLGNVFILPSIGPEETWGLALNEAMAAGKPVIASDKCGGAINLICEGKNGFIVKAGDAIELCKKMTKLSGDTKAANDMGEQSLRIISHFTFENFTEAIERTLIP